MKYLVELAFTNPAHEHVSLRRRVEKVTRLVEATNEQQAILRAASQQRALGFMIKEAKVVKEKEEVVDTDEKTAVAAADKSMKKAENADEKDEDEDEELEEEVEQIDELKKSTLASYVNKAANQVRAKSGIAASFETQGTRKRDPKNKEAYANLAKDFRKGAKKRLTGIEKAAAKLAKEEVETVEEAKDVTKDLRVSMKSMDLRHGVDSDKREAGYKMSPAVRAAQAKSDALSKVEKRPQAGTLAAVHKSMERTMKRNMKEEVEYIEEKLTAADPASKWIHDFVHSENPKFAGKSKKERIQQALGAYYAAKRGD